MMTTKPFAHGFQSTPSADSIAAYEFSLNQYVFQNLRSLILTMQPGYQPGARLNIQAIATELGVSKTPVVFAINQLVALGLVLVRPRSGTFVADPQHDDVHELFQLVAQLEIAATRIMSWPCPETDLQEMSRLANEAKTNMEAEELAAYLDASHSLRIALVNLSGNHKLVEVYTATTHQTYLATAYIALVPGTAEAELERQRTLIDLLHKVDSSCLDREILDYWNHNWDCYLKAREFEPSSELIVPANSRGRKRSSA